MIVTRSKSDCRSYFLISSRSKQLSTWTGSPRADATSCALAHLPMPQEKHGIRCVKANVALFVWVNFDPLFFTVKLLLLSVLNI
jgi:hypothetical protein